MRFLVDMGISPRACDDLNARGHEAVHLYHERLEQASDHEIFLKAIRENRILLTHDLDFADILSRTRETTISVIIFRMSDMRSPVIIKRLEHVLETSSAALESGAIVSVEESRHRVRLLPIGRDRPS